VVSELRGFLFIGPSIDNFLAATPGLSWIPTGLGYQFFFGGTSLLILVGVAMDTVAQSKRNW
jgi:preprotein translocase subunit SecY